jgi:hypothetical protein
VSEPDDDGATSVTAIQPVPTDDEAAAIAAALTVAWPAAPLASDWTADEPSRWRFSGRWWSKPIPVRRDRPI